MCYTTCVSWTQLMKHNCNYHCRLKKLYSKQWFSVSLPLKMQEETDLSKSNLDDHEASAILALNAYWSFDLPICCNFKTLLKIKLKNSYILKFVFFYNLLLWTSYSMPGVNLNSSNFRVRLSIGFTSKVIMYTHDISW